MHSMAHLFILILVSLILSYDQLIKPFSVEATRKLNSNDLSSFTVELIHRNHYYNLSSNYYNVEENIGTENIIPNGGDYLMKMAIGTPPVEFVGVADTGSDLVWVQCSPCDPCIQQNSPLFDSSKSSTYQAIPCDSQSCTPTDLSGRSGCLKDYPNCVYDYSYGDKTESVGYLAKETISFTSSVDGTSIPFPNSTFGCGLAQKGSFGNKGNGIFGLGVGPSSLISQLGPNINYKFSYCLTPLSLGVTSKMKFGADMGSPGVVSTPFTTKAPDHTNYYLTLDGISIGDTSIPTAGLSIIIDSGTTLTLLESSVYEDVVDSIKSAIPVSPKPDPNNLSALCYETQQLAGIAGDEGITPPDVVFHFQGANVVLKSINTFRQSTNAPVACLAMMPTDGDSIFGNIAQVNFEVGYDLQAMQVSFAPADCTSY